MNSQKQETVVGSKTGVMKRPVMSEGFEDKANRTGVFKRSKVSPEKEDDRRREPPMPPNLPEKTDGDGSTTGVVTYETEGRDPARRESHPRR